MTALELVNCLGEKLIGMKVLTEAVGDYVGGVAEVTELISDLAAPEIVFRVKHPTWKDPEGGQTIGVFAWETVYLIG